MRHLAASKALTCTATARVAVLEAAQRWVARERLQALEGFGDAVQALDELSTGYASVGCGFSGRRKKLVLLTLSQGALRMVVVAAFPLLARGSSFGRIKYLKADPCLCGWPCHPAKIKGATPRSLCCLSMPLRKHRSVRSPWPWPADIAL